MKQLEQEWLNQRAQYVHVKLEVKRLDGDILRWREFWDTFEYSIHNNQTLQKVDKWNYLKSQLTGKAADSGLDRTNEN